MLRRKIDLQEEGERNKERNYILFNIYDNMSYIYKFILGLQNRYVKDGYVKIDDVTSKGEVQKIKSSSSIALEIVIFLKKLL